MPNSSSNESDSGARQRKKRRTKGPSMWDTLESQSGKMFSTDNLKNRVYVGNLPRGATEAEISQIFSKYGPTAVLMHERHRRFCFVEFDTSDKADDAAVKFKNFALRDKTLTVGRPSHPLDSTKDGLIAPTMLNDEGEGLTLSGRAYLMRKLLERDKSTAQLAEKLKKETEPTPKPGAVMFPSLPAPSRCVAMKNLVGSPSELDDSIGKEVHEECSRFGDVEQICIYDEPNSETNQVEVTIFVLFTEIKGALRCQQKMNGRFFAKRRVVAQFRSEDDFRKILSMN